MYFRGVSGRWNKCFLDDEMRSKKGIMDVKNEDLCYILVRFNKSLFSIFAAKNHDIIIDLILCENISC